MQTLPSIELLGWAMLAISSTQTVLLALLGAVLTILMIGTRNRVRSSMQAPRQTARKRWNEANDRRQSLREVEDVMVELDQVARQVHGQMDTRFAKLETIIRDADARIAKLERLLQAADGAPTLDVTLEEARPDEPDPAVVMETGPHADVYRLADARMSEIEIAQETGKTTGEIELILALRKARPPASV